MSSRRISAIRSDGSAGALIQRQDATAIPFCLNVPGTAVPGGRCYRGPIYSASQRSARSRSQPTGRSKVRDGFPGAIGEAGEIDDEVAIPYPALSSIEEERER
jgi:hypothetical protein